MNTCKTACCTISRPEAQNAEAAYEFDAFREHIEAMPLANTIVLVGNRDFYEIRNLQQSEQIEQHTRND